MTAQQTMNKTQKDNERCLNIQVSHSRMVRKGGRRGGGGAEGRERSLVVIVVVLSCEWTCLEQ